MGGGGDDGAGSCRLPYNEMGCQNVELESGRKRANSLMCGVHKSHLRSRSRNMSRVPWCVRSLDGLSL